MRNFQESGGTLTLVAPYTVTSGNALLVGAIFGVAAYSAAIGEPVEAKRTGVYELPCLSTDVVAQGAKLYWDNANRRLTTTASGNVLVGAAYAPKASGAAVVLVALDGCIR